jgi:hypothetical protein
LVHNKKTKYVFWNKYAVIIQKNMLLAIGLLRNSLTS